MTTPTSILHPSLHGLIVLSGLPGIGKTTLAATLEHPKLTFFMDFDLKGAALARDYGIDQYHAPNFMKPDQDPLTYDMNRLATWSLQTFKEIKPGTTLVIIDNAPALELGLGNIVEKDPARYGLNAKNVAAGVYGGVNPGIGKLWENIFNWLQSKGVKTVIMINHMSQPWASGAPVPNRWNIKGNKVFRQLSVGTFILVPGDAARGGEPPVPSVLVVKEAMAKRSFDEKAGAFTTIRTLPHRIPVADWPHIKVYFNKPANLKQPAVGETWTADELNAFGSFLSADQIRWIREAGKLGFSEDGPSQAQKKPTAPPTATTPVVNPLVAGRQKLFVELQPHYTTMDEIAITVHNLNLTYSVEKHDEIKAALLKEKGIVPTK